MIDPSGPPLAAIAPKINVHFEEAAEADNHRIEPANVRALPQISIVEPTTDPMWEANVQWARLSPADRVPLLELLWLTLSEQEQSEFLNWADAKPEALAQSPEPPAEAVSSEQQRATTEQPAPKSAEVSADVSDGSCADSSFRTPASEGSPGDPSPRDGSGFNLREPPEPPDDNGPTEIGPLPDCRLGDPGSSVGISEDASASGNAFGDPAAGDGTKPGLHTLGDGPADPNAGTGLGVSPSDSGTSEPAADEDTRPNPLAQDGFGGPAVEDGASQIAPTPVDTTDTEPEPRPPPQPPRTSAEGPTPGDTLRNLYGATSDEERTADWKFIERYIRYREVPDDPSPHMNAYLAATPIEQANHVRYLTRLNSGIVA
jgi:hypothetical protein